MLVLDGKKRMFGNCRIRVPKAHVYEGTGQHNESKSLYNNRKQTLQPWINNPRGSLCFKPSPHSVRNSSRIWIRAFLVKHPHSLVFCITRLWVGFRSTRIPWPAIYPTRQTRCLWRHFTAMTSPRTRLRLPSNVVWSHVCHKNIGFCITVLKTNHSFTSLIYPCTFSVYFGPRSNVCTARALWHYFLLMFDGFCCVSDAE